MWDGLGCRTHCSGGARQQRQQRVIFGASPSDALKYCSMALECIQTSNYINADRAAAASLHMRSRSASAGTPPAASRHRASFANALSRFVTGLADALQLLFVSSSRLLEKGSWACSPKKFDDLSNNLYVLLKCATIRSRRPSAKMRARGQPLPVTPGRW